MVNFDLQFSRHIDKKEAEEQLIAGLQELGPTEFVIDFDSIQISGIEQQLSCCQVEVCNFLC